MFDHFEVAKPVGDIAALGVFIGYLANWLPTIATAVTIVWGLLRCYDAFLDIQAKRRRNNDQS